MASVNGYAIRYLDYNNSNPSSRVLLLLHGIGASSERWLRVAPTLSKHFRVVIPDIIGFGYSDKPTVEYNSDFFVDFLSGFLHGLGISKPIIVGSSFGGFVGAEFAIKFNRNVERLILAAPAGVMRTSTPVLDKYIMAALYPTYENALNAFSEMAYDPTVVSDETVRDFVNRMRLPNAKYAFMSTLLGMRHSPRLQGRLSKIVAPTLLVWGDSDRMIPPEYSQDYSEIPGSEWVIIKQCGHTPYVEKPMSFNKVLLKFLINNSDE